MLRIAVFLGAVVALSSACCTPDQWEGNQGSTIGYSGPGRKGGLIREYVEVAYDFTNKRTAAKLFYFNEGVKAELKIVVRYDDDVQDCDGTCEKGKMYIVNVKKQKCYKKPLMEDFRKACVPKDAREMGDYFLGLKGGLAATAYEFDGKRFSASISVTKAKNGVCIPLGEVVAAQKGRYSTLSTVGFADITPGIKNATVFDVPELCEDDDFFPEQLLTRMDHFFAL